MALHVEVGSSEMGRSAFIKVSRDCQCLQKHFRHENSAAPVQHNPSLIEARQRAGQPAEIPMAGGAQGGAI